MRKAFIVAGMAFGDESKGATTEFLCKRHGASLVVRYNGGSQALHHVVQADGRVHGFSQFGSGSFLPDVKTHLSKYMLVNPLSQMKEEEHLRELGLTDMWERTTISKDCVVVTPIHRAVNRLREMVRGDRRHGSCGVGIGVAREFSLLQPDDTLVVGDLSDSRKTFSKLLKMRWFYRNILSELGDLVLAGEASEELEWLLTDAHLEELVSQYEKWPGQVVDSFAPEEVMVFEGAQGVLLDERYGAPHNTWTRTTFENAFALLGEAGCDKDIDVTRVGCWRTYFTRHGAGPLPTEVNNAPFKLPEEAHNKTGRYQGDWRVGSFDMQLAKTAIEMCRGVDLISISHYDVAHPPQSFLDDPLSARVGIIADGPTVSDREERPCPR